MLFKSLMTGGEAQAVRTQEKVSKGRVTLTELSFNLIDLNRKPNKMQLSGDIEKDETAFWVNTLTEHH